MAREVIKDTRRIAEENGRDGNDIKFYQGLSFVIGDTEEEALRKEIKLEEKIDIDMMVAHLAGGLGIDMGNLPLDTPLEVIETDGVRSIAEWVQQSTPGRVPTIEDLARLQGKTTRIVGTPESIADQLERWQEAGVDGINVINATIPGSYEEFIDKVIPVLRERGLARAENEEATTLRHKLFGEDRLNERHPAAQYRGAFATKSVTN